MKRRSLAALAAAVLLLAPLSACSGAMYSDAVAPAVDAVTDGGFSGAAAESTDLRSVDGTSVIRTGDVSIRVGDPAAAAGRIGQIVDGLGGYVESETVRDGDGGGAASATLTVRVPADRFDDAFAALGEVGEVTSQSRSAADVTLQHADLEARVHALEESVERLLELMSGAATTGELIEAESALSDRQQELDGLRAQLDALEDQVEQSTIWVWLSTETAIPGGPANFWEGVLLGLDSLAKGAAGALVLLGVALPWLIVLGVIAGITLLIVWLSLRGRRARGDTRE